MNEVQVLVTGLAWMGGGMRSIARVLDELLASANDEVMVTAYTVGSTSEHIFGWLENLLARGIKVRMVVNHLERQIPEVVNALKTLASQYPHFHLYSFESEEENTDLHAKIIVVDRKKALTGSANISHRGWIANHELALLVDGRPAGDIALAIERLLQSKFCVRVRG